MVKAGYFTYGDGFMTRSDLIEKLAIETGTSITVAEAIVQELFSSMVDSLIAGDRIEVRGFGSFEIREYEGYSGRNPKTGETVSVTPKKLPYFKVGKHLKRRILDSGK
jgi:integration host factor subunit beta